MKWIKWLILIVFFIIMLLMGPGMRLLMGIALAAVLLFKPTLFTANTENQNFRGRSIFNPQS